MVAQDCQPNFKYDREQWNEEYSHIISTEATRDVKGNYINFILNIAIQFDTIPRRKFKTVLSIPAPGVTTSRDDQTSGSKKTRLHN